MGDLSEHFSRREFACECGCSFDTVDAELIKLCEIVRELNGNKPITVSSGNRCEKQNSSTTGASATSKHTLGRAADLMVDNPPYVYTVLCRRFPNRYGFGLYHNRVHVDSRKNAARWEHG